MSDIQQDKKESVFTIVWFDAKTLLDCMQLIQCFQPKGRFFVHATPTSFQMYDASGALEVHFFLPGTYGKFIVERTVDFSVQYAALKVVLSQPHAQPGNSIYLRATKENLHTTVIARTWKEIPLNIIPWSRIGIPNPLPLSQLKIDVSANELQVALRNTECSTISFEWKPPQIVVNRKYSLAVVEQPAGEQDGYKWFVDWNDIKSALDALSEVRVVTLDFYKTQLMKLAFEVSEALIIYSVLYKEAE